VPVVTDSGVEVKVGVGELVAIAVLVEVGDGEGGSISGGSGVEDAVGLGVVVVESAGVCVAKVGMSDGVGEEFVAVPVNVGWSVLVEIVDSVGVVANVLVKAGCAVWVEVGVLEGLVPPGADFQGGLVGFRVGGEVWVGHVIGLSAGSSVGDCVCKTLLGLVGVFWDVGGDNGVVAGWLGVGNVIVGGAGLTGTGTWGVIVGTGVSKL
jgi:hypothetical protein